SANTLKWDLEHGSLLSRALAILMQGRVHFGLAVIGSEGAILDAPHSARAQLDDAVDGLRAAGQRDYLPRGLLARAAFRLCVGDLAESARDLDEVEEIAETGQMRLFLCDLALERSRLMFARVEAFMPLNGMIDN